MSDYLDKIDISDKLDGVIDASMGKVKVAKRRENGRKAAILACCGLVLAGTGVGLTDTAFASRLPIIGSIFTKMENKTTYKGDMENDATHLIDEESIVKLENHEVVENPYVKVSNGLTVSITEASFDRTGLYLGMTLQNETAFPEGFDLKKQREDYGLAYNTFGVWGTCAIKDTAGNVIVESRIGDFLGDYVDSNTFAGIAQIDLTQLPGTYDTFACEITIDNFYNEDYTIVSGNDRTYYEGEWKYSLDVALDSANEQMVSVNTFDDAGYGIEAVHKSKYTITVDTKLPDSGMDYFVAVCDANGDLLEYQGSNIECYSIFGRDVSKVSVFVCDRDEYMTKLKGYYHSSDYAEKKLEKTFAQYLKEYAKYDAQVTFE